MKQLLLLCIIVCYAGRCMCQDAEYSYVDRKMAAMPSPKTLSTADIAAYVQSNFTNSKEKFRAIYSWVANNIRYDKDSMYIINWNNGGEAKATEALRRRKGVCENYAALFNDIANKCGLTSFVVDGYSRQNGFLDKTGHSWCAVELNNEWFLCDPTWDKDARGNTNYFLVQPIDFLNTHFPFDPMWQLLNYPAVYTEFVNGTYGKNNKPFFNFQDSINAFASFTPLQQLENTSLHVKNNAQENQLSKNRIAYNNMQVNIVYEEKDMQNYNAAVADMNKASTEFNNYLQYRNNKVIPTTDDHKLQTMLDAVTSSIAAADKKIKALSIYNQQYNPEEIQNRLTMLTKKVADEKEYLKKYYANTTEKKLL